ncbi:hypothetical protein VF14_28090 [Nostoc linckia z18]|jgi:hypothetical protein|uniref:Uncharacterized protein n=2 Tax=Nostoc linckia TaxID=92942 RepID=A0A9Q6EKJ6_NOSLI|nr:hypothetical protein [Nostoc linckia]PHK39619.1 hypothetical protein VF12_13620 [Nostoc linckia z15]PHK43310.1 hypothetical protein VF13_27815 [Nostoc linckia z16]PHJ57721.1 hypothetical protein VF02_29640 [Nostoc linckia z1]PHJ57897.1 hypothetical protein VF05_34925 [Nostoc linckia z3]PHJ69403.1 hypothetical protein VF03_23970 [Nostoc linckia z2]
MLKPLLLSGWFRAQPFLNYVVVVILIAPLLGASGHSTPVKSEVVKRTSITEESEPVSKEIALVGEPEIAETLTVDGVNSSAEEVDSVPTQSSAIQAPQVLPEYKDYKIESFAQLDSSLASSDLNVPDPLAEVELAPLTDVPVGQIKLVQKLKAAHIKSLKEEKIYLPREKRFTESLAATQIAPTIKDPQPTITTEIPNSEPVDESQAEQIDPIGSPHPIPWKWITTTQEAISSNGGSGVRHYRSIPVISPDGKYAVYSRVQLEVKPEMYNSRVTSVLFVQDRQTKKMWVMASTTPVSDPLLKTKALKAVSAEETDTTGQIGVLVPVSWSEKGDRFLARKFEGVFNTGDSTDSAVIWDRQKNHANVVAPANEEHDAEKIAVLLGWSKSQPDHVLFRAGELGEENWPLVKVANDGKTVSTTDDDQPITFGKQVTEIWAGPQVAYR